jgi:hypothetical protein
MEVIIEGGSMRIRFENTMDDVVAFSRYCFRHSPTMIRTRRYVVWGIPLLIGCPVAWYWVANGMYESLVCFMLGCSIYVLVYPRLMLWSHGRAVRRIYMEGKNRGVVGWHELELTDLTLIERCEVGESTIRIDGIERIVSDGDYTFVFVSAVSAHIIPRASITEGDYDLFVSALQNKYTGNGGKVNDG